MNNKFLVTTALLLGVGANAQAATLTLDLDSEFSGAQVPQGTSPWLTAVFDDDTGDTDTVLLTMTTNGLVADELVGEWLFNFNDDKIVGDLGISISSDPSSNTATFADKNNLKGDGGGFHDFGFTFPPPPGGPGANYFTAGESMTVLLSYTGGLVVGDFDFTSANYNTDDGLYAPDAQWGGDNYRHQSSAHIMGIADTVYCDGSTGELTGPCGSGWIGPGDGSFPPAGVVPVPAAVWLFGSGLLGLIGIARRKKSA